MYKQSFSEGRGSGGSGSGGSVIDNPQLRILANNSIDVSMIADNYCWMSNLLYNPLVQLILYYRVVFREDLWGLSQPLDEANELLATEARVVKKGWMMLLPWMFNFIPLTINLICCTNLSYTDFMIPSDSSSKNCFKWLSRESSTG